MDHRVLQAMLMATAFATACAPTDDEVGSTDGGPCEAADCRNRCTASGYSNGYCRESTCICDAADAGTDGDAADDAATEHAAERCDIDILFVYDTSGSMMDAVGPLTSEAFPAFAEALATYPHLGSVRVAVKTNLFGEHVFDNGGIGYSCDGGVPETIQTSYFLRHGWDPGTPHDARCCEEIPDVDCGFAPDVRWIEGPSATMLDQFACVANVPCQQDVFAGEPTLQGGLTGLEYDGNAGFLREGAVLVVVFLTDEEDQSDMAPAAIHDRLLALKGGDPRYVAVVTIAGPRVGTVEVNPVTHARGCMGTYGGTEQTPRIIGFTELFGDRGLHYEMCGDNDMSGALAAAFDVLELSCDEVILL
ncbi:MAG: hypothetical protein QME96_12030 [Myxococcota bacterium]|nr:hypothetical protein [Myxococcota bacterium]